MKKTILLLIIYFISANCIYSQNDFNVRSMSMGFTSVANSFDLDAFNQNPANILSQRANNNALVYFNIVTSGGIMTSSSYLSIDFYNDYFTKDANGNTRFLTDQDKSTILSEAGNELSSYLGSVKLISVIYNTQKSGTFGISLDEWSSGNFIPSQGFLELGLYGNQRNETYDISESEVNAYWIRQLNFSFAKSLSLKNNKTFDKVSFGVSVKPQFGIYYLNTENNDLSVTTNDSNVINSSGTMEFLYAGLTDDNDFRYSAGNAGFGFGFDAGVNARLKNFSRYGNLNIGLSLTDIGYINWTKNTFNYFYDGNYVITDITQEEQRDSLRNIIKGSKTPTSDFSVGLPATLRLGVSFQLFKNAKRDSATLEEATFSLDYIQGFNNNYGATTTPVIGLGFEYNLSKVVSPRLGFGFGGSDDFAMSIGLGIDTGPVLIDMGTYNITTIFEPEGTTKYSAGLNIKFKVN